MSAPTGPCPWFGKGLAAVASGAIPLGGADIYAMITTSSYTPNQDTHQYRSDVTNEVSGTGYTAAGKACTCSVAYDSTSKEVRFIVASPSWTSATITGRTVVFYRKLGGASSSDPVIGYVTYDQDVVSTNGTWTANVDSASAHGGALGTLTVS